MTPNELTPDLAAFIEATNEYFSRHRQSKRTASRCPMLALSGHGDRAQRCPLSGVKRTLADLLGADAGKSEAS
jgi:hypothetical protein